jgi:hypothetical protein
MVTVKPKDSSPSSNDEQSFYWPALGDFNGDGTLDFIGQPEYKAPISLLLGKGDGTFTSHPIATAQAPYWQARAADLNRDGWLDLVTITIPAEQFGVMVRLGNGDPISFFASATTYPSTANRLLLGDLNDDGHVDLVTGEENGLGLWWGSAEGRFEKSSEISVGNESNLLMATDWNRDGVLDLVFGSVTLRMLLGHGDGTFGNVISCGLAVPHNILADFDHDQKIDLVARQTGVLLGMNGCNFTSLVPVPNWSVGKGDEVGVADLNGDGHADIVLMESKPDFQISVYLGNGRGGFSDPKNFPGIGPRHFGGSFFFGYPEINGYYLIGDLNRDTKLDIILTTTEGWRVLLNTCP